MKKIKIAVEIDGATTEYVVTPRAQVDFERKFDLGLGDIARTDHVYYLAYATMKSAGATTADYDTWLNTLDGAEMGSDESAPLDPDPSDGS